MIKALKTTFFRNRHQRVTFKAGDTLPREDIPAEALEKLLATGIVVDLDAEEALQEERRIAAIPTRPKARGKWRHPPSTLKGLSLEDLLILIEECDPGVDLCQFNSKKKARELLSSDWIPEDGDCIAPKSSDKMEPGHVTGATPEDLQEARRLARGEDE